MRREPGVLVDLVEKTLHRVLDRPHRDPPATAAEKKSGSVAGRADAAQQLVALGLVISEGQLGVVTDGYDPLLSSLPPHFHLLRKQVDVHSIDAAQLRESHAGRVEELEDGGVADVAELPSLRLEPGRLEQHFDLRAVEV